MDGWLDGLMSYSTVFQSCKDDGRLVMKCSVQWSAARIWIESCWRSCLQQGSNPHPSNPKLSLETVAWPRLFSQLGSTTVKILCIGTDRSQQTMQTKIRLLLKKQSDQGLHCLPLHQLLLDALCNVTSNFTNFRTIMAIVWGVPNFRIFTVT